MSSVRAGEVAEILWELKSANKLATCSEVARRAGFRTGQGGKAVQACMRLVRRDWPHLEWWRILQDGGVIDDDLSQIACLEAAGYEVEQKKRQGRKVTLVKSVEELLMEWKEIEEFEVQTDWRDDTDSLE